MILLSDTIVDFHLFSDGAVDIQIRALLTRSQCKVSDTQVTVKTHGPLVQGFYCQLSFNNFDKGQGHTEFMNVRDTSYHDEILTCQKSVTMS